MFWLEIEVTVADEHRDAVSNVFFELGSGVQEEPASIHSGAAVIRGWFPVGDRQLQQKVVLLRRRVEAITGPPARMEVRRASDRDWATAWREGLKPFRVGERLVVKPTWEEWEPGPEDLVIEIDPGLAFGCGTHPTTAMCLKLLERYVRPGMVAVDVGTGSGILAVAAALLGAAVVWAVDEDPLAVRTAAENVARHNLTGRVRVRSGNLLDELSEPADLVVANIVAEVLAELCPAAATALEPGGVFIFSGILDQREDIVRRALAADGFRVESRLAEGEWVALAGVKE
ncbi:MAG: 50S ribosomal protein L11 methyltransferase [Bacillota bacterium]